MADILKLVQSNATPLQGAEATRVLVQFLRDYADEIENGDDEATAAVLILYNRNQDGKFRTASRRCNIDVLAATGLVHTALHDICVEGYED